MKSVRNLTIAHSAWAGVAACLLISCSSDPESSSDQVNSSTGGETAVTGGASTGGTATGGTATGGITTTGGTSTGGTSTGGGSSGGMSTGGMSTGGGSSGGAPSGGMPSGGVSTGGGMPIGGAGTGGGMPTGGTETGGGMPTGGTETGGGMPTGGTETGGGMPTGGTETGGGMPTGGAETGGAPSGGAETGGEATGGDAAGGSGGGDTCQTGAIAASEVVIMGESFYAMAPQYIQQRIEENARNAGALGANEHYRNVAISGQPMSVVAGEYDTALQGGPVKFVIMDGGGIDCMSSPCDSCPGTFETVLAKMASNGVEDVIYTRYPEPGNPPGSNTTLKNNLDTLMPKMEAVCAASTAPRCHWVDLRPVWVNGDTTDGLHPTQSGGEHCGDAIWAKMVEECLAQ